jgi:hypothetical protein
MNDIVLQYQREAVLGSDPSIQLVHALQHIIHFHLQCIVHIHVGGCMCCHYTTLWPAGMIQSPCMACQHSNGIETPNFTGKLSIGFFLVILYNYLTTHTVCMKCIKVSIDSASH